MSGFDRLLNCFSNNDTFPKGQAIRLDHNRSTLLFDIGLGFLKVRECAIGCCWNAVFDHNFLSKILGPLQLRCQSCRTKGFETSCIKIIHDTSSKGIIWTNKGPSNIVGLCKLNQFIMFGNRDIYQFQTVQSHPVIPRSHKDFFNVF